MYSPCPSRLLLQPVSRNSSICERTICAHYAVALNKIEITLTVAPELSEWLSIIITKKPSADSLLQNLKFRYQ